MIDCKAPEHEIQGHALFSLGRVKTILNAIGRRQNTATSSQELRGVLNGVAVACKAKPVDSVKDLQGTIARMTDASWWTRNLRRELLRENEAAEHADGLIRRASQCYCTDHASSTKAERAKVNQATLDGLEVCNDEGEAFNLGEVAAASVSNPKLRRAELMTRCRGFEEAAQWMGHKGLFLTVTTPSRFHRVNHFGILNKKWEGATPKDGQKYLCKAWEKIRAAWKKKGIIVYGFRVAEPHHDATPHWHILLFCGVADVRAMLAIAARYALADTPNESGAKKRRFTVKRIDPNHGSATGYIAKYICKNIDGLKETGEGVGLDFDSGTDATSAANRVRDWASTWGIRQFQQIGGPSVTVWRELRRLGKDADTLQLELFEKPRAAASRGAWFDFWMLQGGPEVARAELTLKPLYVPDSLGKYGDEAPHVMGITGTDGPLEYAQITRLHTWTVQRAGAAEQCNAQAAWDRTLAFSKTDFAKAYRDLEFKRIDAVERTRTGINNCSDAKKPEIFDFSNFDKNDPADTAHLYWTGTPGSSTDQLEAVETANFEFERLNRFSIAPPSRLPGNF